jgi:hypothetical protein
MHGRRGLVTRHIKFVLAGLAICLYFQTEVAVLTIVKNIGGKLFSPQGTHSFFFRAKTELY